MSLTKLCWIEHIVLLISSHAWPSLSLKRPVSSQKPWSYSINPPSQPPTPLVSSLICLASRRSRKPLRDPFHFLLVIALETREISLSLIHNAAGAIHQNQEFSPIFIATQKWRVHKQGSRIQFFRSFRHRILTIPTPQPIWQNHILTQGNNFWQPMKQESFTWLFASTSAAPLSSVKTPTTCSSETKRIIVYSDEALKYLEYSQSVPPHSIQDGKLRQWRRTHSPTELRKEEVQKKRKFSSIVTGRGHFEATAIKHHRDCGYTFKVY